MDKDTNLINDIWPEEILKWDDDTAQESDGAEQMPSLVYLDEALHKTFPPPPELIEGILRKGHKMVLSGPSKAGKSFLLMELAVALAGGKEWLGFKCRKSRVLYANLEIEPASFIRRFQKIYDAEGTPYEEAKDILVWNLRGNAKPLDKLVPELCEVILREHCDAVIIDPIYKVISGDENSASDMSNFCNQFDELCSRSGASVIYVHHHSKSASSTGNAGNRLSGSGVFTRDVDALLDIVQLKYDDEQDSGTTAWRMESVLREFASIKPVNLFFRFPLHAADENGELDNAPFMYGGSGKSKSYQDKKKKRLDDAYDSCGSKEAITISDLAEKMCCTERTVRSYIKENESYSYDKGIVQRKDG